MNYMHGLLPMASFYDLLLLLHITFVMFIHLLITYSFIFTNVSNYTV